MDRDKEFLKLLTKCKETLQKYMPDHPDQKRRYELMIKSIKGLSYTAKQGKVYTKLRFVQVTYMINRNDPEELIDAVVNLDKFYADNYRKI
ncbi:hypothetical protein WAK64_04270 [Bacillus spongiae]|uniref:Uncharacterized protein n=1 Tax=Bacillus spongiae TaxID=2683610 RepID=A0ABU8HAL2_9BACI